MSEIRIESVSLLQNQIIRMHQEAYGFAKSLLFRHVPWKKWYRNTIPFDLFPGSAMSLSPLALQYQSPYSGYRYQTMFLVKNSISCQESAVSVRVKIGHNSIVTSASSPLHSPIGMHSTLILWIFCHALTLESLTIVNFKWVNVFSEKVVTYLVWKTVHIASL